MEHCRHIAADGKLLDFDTYINAHGTTDAIRADSARAKARFKAAEAAYARANFDAEAAYAACDAARDAAEAARVAGDAARKAKATAAKFDDAIATRAGTVHWSNPEANVAKARNRARNTAEHRHAA